MAKITIDRLIDAATHFCRKVQEILWCFDMQKRLFATYREDDPTRSPRFGHFFVRLNELLVDHWFLSIARLHDPAYESGWNITVSYFAESPHIEAETAERMRGLAARMDVLAQAARLPRNKALAHNDLDKIVGRR